MESSTPLRRIIPVLLAFAVGFGLAWTMRAPDQGSVSASGRPVIAAVPGYAAVSGFGDASTAPVKPPPPVPGNAAAPGGAGVDVLWQRALAPGDAQGSSYVAQDRLRKLAQADPTVRRRLIGFYDTARNPHARELLQAILATVQTPDVVFFANRLANSGNAADRVFGFEMLQGVAPDTAETRALVRRTLASEQAPEVVLVALSALRSGAADPDEAAQVLAQLTTLAQHADPAVRARSIAQLGQWDKDGESGAGLARALNDSALEVRQAAVFAIAQANVRPARAKDSLLALAGNAQESRDLRGSALQALERFQLSKEEYAEFARLRAQWSGMQ